VKEFHLVIKCAGSKEGSKGNQRSSGQQDQRTDLEV
jgi:hypothetical protein